MKNLLLILLAAFVFCASVPGDNGYILGPSIPHIPVTKLNAQLTRTQRNGLNTIYPINTGQTTSYATGDDGYYQYGRLVNFTTLSSPNSFGNTNRFTSITGDTTFHTYNYAIDNATGLGWYIKMLPSATWANAVAANSTFTLTVNGVTYNDFFLPNIFELASLANFGITSANNSFYYSPFFLTSGLSFGLWSSTTIPNLTTNATFVSLRNGTTYYLSTSTAKTNTNQYLLCRKHF